MDVMPLVEELNMDLTASRKEELKKHLATALNDLLLHDFQGLVQLLYRVDVPEKKLKKLLAENPGTDAGDLLADLVMQRQEEKKRLRDTFRTPPPANEEDRW